MRLHDLELEEFQVHGIGRVLRTRCRLNEGGLFLKSSLADRITILAIYMPIIRREVYDFVHTWNIHHIHHQPNCPNVPTGKPFMLYHYPPAGFNDYGQVPNPRRPMNLTFANGASHALACLQQSGRKTRWFRFVVYPENP